MRPASYITALCLILATGCETRRRARTPAGMSQPVACTASNQAARQCAAAVLRQCDGAGSWVEVEDCAASMKICGADGAGNLACIEAVSGCAATQSCPPGTECTTDQVCASRACGAAGFCLGATCGNAQQDGSETGVDCGGDCPACFGEPCSAPEQCITNDCRQGMCSEPSCTDGIRNGTESAADCGGDCQPCDIGATCRGNTDCQSGVCDNQRCAAPPASCTDGIKSGDETDVDCGGASCPGCGLNRSCFGDGDCISAWCNLGTCDRATCADQIQNQGEADVDCGGPACPGCADRAACAAGSDCASSRCDGSVCASCVDGVRTGGETGVDCGGPCGPCDVGTACGAPGECASGRCEQGRCASCSDGQRTGSEADADCGGPCPRCQDGQMCSTPRDCAGNGCEASRCCTLNACGTCGPAPREVCNGRDDDCDSRVDEASDLTAPLCDNQEGVCRNSRAQCRGTAGWVCDTAAYLAHSADYETTETTCDRLDNDCDGTVNHVPCGSTTVCTFGFCRESGLCVTNYRPEGAACLDTATGVADPNLQQACNGNRNCWQTYAVCNCARVDSRGVGQSCFLRYNRSFGGTDRSTNTCACSSNDHLNFTYNGPNGTVGAAESRCVSCYADGEGRFACTR